MAGSDESGEEMQSGRTNRAEDHTRIWAQQRLGEQFNGDTIFVVEGAGDIEDEDFTLPSGKIHGILGVGVGAGAGVIGHDASSPDQDISQVRDVGVFGRGKTGVEGEGTRGPGVEGVGSNHSTSLLGAGVVGRGGRQPDENNAERTPHGPGVIGIGGGRAREVKTGNNIAASVGVFGQGAEAEARTVGGTIHGPALPGAGVVGRGGVSIPNEGPVAPGVIGWAGGADTAPDLAIEGDIGVQGIGGIGVEGIGMAGPGVRGFGSDGEGGAAGNRGILGPGVVGEGGTGRNPADPKTFFHGAGVIGIAGGTPLPPLAETIETGVYGAGRDGVEGAGSEGRGGIFRSEHSAQIALIPARRPTKSKEQAAFIPTVIADPGLQGPALPLEGRSGDLMSVIDDEGQCLLWFCVRDNDGSAHWAQVLLGPSFTQHPN